MLGTDGFLIASHRDGSIKRYDPSTGKAISSFGVKPVVYGGSSYSDGKVLNLWQDFSVTREGGQDLVQPVEPEERKPRTVQCCQQHKRALPEGRPRPRGTKLWHFSNPDAFYSKIPKEFYPNGSTPGIPTNTTGPSGIRTST